MAASFTSVASGGTVIVGPLKGIVLIMTVYLLLY
jgi:hypothetical protein